jgi:RNA polymerase sigma-70 factor (ECF subfamily)
VRKGLTNAEVADVYRTYGHLVLRRCRAILRDEALAEDAFQEAFIKVMRYGAAMREAGSPLRWLYRVADRCCFDALGRRKRRAEAEMPPEEVGGPHPGESLAMRHTVMGFLHRLGDKDRVIAVLHFIDGLSQGEIGEELGWSRQTINKRLGRIRERAEKTLRSAYG